jgi:beta-galactosidase/beta-glucuronidase
MTLHIDEILSKLTDEATEILALDERLCARLKEGGRSLDLVRPEFPRPQLVRDGGWLNLNGIWEFEMDFGRSGRERSVNKAASLGSEILVPYAPESKLSGIGHTDFIPAVWYRKSVHVPPSWSANRLLLHIGACDYRTWVYINGQEVGNHVGGYTPFSFDITKFVAGESNFTITVYAEDDPRSGAQTNGKQSQTYHSQGCDYTRTTGLWQTVWLESVPQTYVEHLRLTPLLDSGGALIEVRAAGDVAPRGTKLRLTASSEGKKVGETTLPLSGTIAGGFLAINDPRAWAIDDPFLYDLKIELIAPAGETVDIVNSYFGLRSVTVNGYGIEINRKVVFQRLILDQGFYPDGIYTAPSDAALKRDIQLSMDAGFNGARLHQKVFDPRFLYWADKMGYLVWGEAPDWGLDLTNANGLSAFVLAWVEELERDFNHPAIIGWCPFNEHHPKTNPDSIRSIYKITKAYDPTRPVIDTSGYHHVETDIYDVHEYIQDPEQFAAQFSSLNEDNGTVFENHKTFSTGHYVAGQPYWVSEYGGIKWNPSASGDAWGYGEAPKTEEDFKARYIGLTDALLNNPRMCAFCYTQLTDVEQEVNGIYYYDRSPKFDPGFFKAINSQKAAIEK